MKPLERRVNRLMIRFCTFTIVLIQQRDVRFSCADKTLQRKSLLESKEEEVPAGLHLICCCPPPPLPPPHALMIKCPLVVYMRHVRFVVTATRPLLSQSFRLWKDLIVIVSFFLKTNGRHWQTPAFSVVCMYVSGVFPSSFAVSYRVLHLNNSIHWQICLFYFFATFNIRGRGGGA